MRSGSSPAFAASRRRIRNAPLRVSAPPRAVRNSSGRWRRRGATSPAREAEPGGGIVVTGTEQHLVAEEGADRGDPPRDGCGGEAGCTQLGDVGLEILASRRRDRPAECLGERAEVAPV